MARCADQRSCPATGGFAEEVLHVFEGTAAGQCDGQEVVRNPFLQLLIAKQVTYFDKHKSAYAPPRDLQLKLGCIQLVDASERWCLVDDREV